MRLHSGDGAGPRPRLVRGVRERNARLRASAGGHYLMPAGTTQAKIRELNDAFRTTMDARLGRVMMTAGVDALASDVKAMVIRRVSMFSDFNADNDPHGEHDFGSFTIVGRKIFWKIDLYEETGVKGDDGQPVISRVLTIMLAEEW